MAQVDVNRGLAELARLLGSRPRIGLLLSVATMEAGSVRWFYTGRGYVADDALTARPPVVCKIPDGIFVSSLPEQLMITLRDLWIPGPEIIPRLEAITQGADDFQFRAQSADCSERRFSSYPGKLTAWPENTFVFNGSSPSAPTPTLRTFIHDGEDQSSPQVFVRDWIWKQLLPCRSVIVDGAAISFGGALAIVVPDTRARLNTPIWQGGCVAVSAAVAPTLSLQKLRVRATFADIGGVESRAAPEAVDPVANRFDEPAGAVSVAVRLMSENEILDEYRLPKDPSPPDVLFDDQFLSEEWGEEDSADGETTFRRVVSGVHFCGRNFLERSPAFSLLDEEGLRDVVTASLAIAFPNTTAESFSKKGKTDILVRSQGRTTFVAECKIWGGTVVYHDAINQLLDRYLTWRDERNASVVIFNKDNKDFKRLLGTIEKDTPKHPYYAKTGRIDKTSGTFEYFFKSKESEDVRLLVLVFNLHRAT